MTDNDTNSDASGTTLTDVENKTEADVARETAFHGVDDADVGTEVIRREAGVRLRTNVQAGSASERAEVTLENHAPDMAGLVQQLDSHRQVVSEELASAIADAKAANRDGEGDS